jgi:hypothetical protein
MVSIPTEMAFTYLVLNVVFCGTVGYVLYSFGYYLIGTVVTSIIAVFWLFYMVDELVTERLNSHTSD